MTTEVKPPLRHRPILFTMPCSFRCVAATIFFCATAAKKKQCSEFGKLKFHKTIHLTEKWNAHISTISIFPSASECQACQRVSQEVISSFDSAKWVRFHPTWASSHPKTSTSSLFQVENNFSFLCSKINTKQWSLVAQSIFRTQETSNNWKKPLDYCVPVFSGTTRTLQIFG